MKSAFHTRSTGKQLSYRIEYDGGSYKIFYRDRFLKLGKAEVPAGVPRWSDQREEANLRQAMADIEALAGMPEV